MRIYETNTFKKAIPLPALALVQTQTQMPTAIIIIRIALWVQKKAGILSRPVCKP